MAASASTPRPINLKRAVAFRGVYFATSDATLAAGSTYGIEIDSNNDFDLTIVDNRAAALDIKQGSNSYLTFVTTDGSEAVKVSKTLDVNAALDLDHALTAAGEAANVAVTINHATAAAEGIDASVAQLTTARSSGVVSGVKSSVTSLAGDSGGDYANFVAGITDGGGSAVHSVIYSADAADFLVKAAASGDAGVTVSSDGMTLDPETATESGYITVDVAGTSYQVPIYSA